MIKAPKRFSVITLILCAFLFTSPCYADHPNKAHRPTVKQESSLAGVYIDSQLHHGLRNDDGVYIEPIDSILKLLGLPTKVITRNHCESSYLWIKGEVRIEVGAGCIFQKISGKLVNRGHGAYSIDVWGEHPMGTVGVTGKGLALGDLWLRVKQIYGTHGEFGRYTSGTGTQNTHGFKYSYYALYQWGDVVALSVDADSQGHVVHIQLLGDLE